MTCRGRFQAATAGLGPLALAALLGLAACAGVPEREPVRDPFERANRIAYRFDQMLDRKLIGPTARLYARGEPDRLPGKIRNRIRNFFENTLGPIDIANNFLQGKFLRGFSGIGRLLVNTTIGLGGLFDPAARWGMPRYPEDFGQTLAVWGLPPGPYVYLPLLGPRNARDLAGFAVDWQLNPVVQHDDTSTRNGLIVLGLIDRRTDGFPRDFTREHQPDPYLFDRNDIYSSRRYNEIWHDGETRMNLEDYFLEEE